MNAKQKLLYLWRDSGLSEGTVAWYLFVMACNQWWHYLSDRASEAWTQIAVLLLCTVFILNWHAVVAVVRQRRRHRGIRAAFDVERGLFQHALAEGDLPLAKQHLDILDRLSVAYRPEDAYGPGAEAVSGAQTPGPEGEKPQGGGSGP